MKTSFRTISIFFDGSSCYESFRTFILEPFSLTKDNGAKFKSFKESVLYIEEALQVYFARVDEQWNQFSSEKLLNVIDLQGVPLPRNYTIFFPTLFGFSR
ncbi:hypothetical protein SEUBUCD646_0K00120 [Saccharomyces eubayanus]|uniref:Uncharacterized protein n=1 Tax=Saccharomyces eubayanus TaxID=1080349 RepID=A0ABN8VCU3_SACEU|nr:hypothetical protein SEUBUCD650_0K00120 [Saccharomyces eubayanus]CAI1550083.1 hypothetical protein SEUBUCD646_0K00120 [Saccharomyces eubayanus]